jgi:hypothetical protein
MTDVFSPPDVFAVGVAVDDRLISICALLGATVNSSGEVTNWNAVQSDGSAAAHPNFNRIPEATRRLIVNEIASAIAIA